jgi:hypothetical protein
MAVMEFSKGIQGKCLTAGQRFCIGAWKGSEGRLTLFHCVKKVAAGDRFHALKEYPNCLP